MTNALRNWFFYGAGILFLAMSKARFLLKGYSPKPISNDQMQACADYDIRVVDRYISNLHTYTGEEPSLVLKGKRVLELGPGSDLGVGLYLLAQGARAYNAVDVFNLVENVPDDFYQVFMNTLWQKVEDLDARMLWDELEKAQQGAGDRLNYVCQPDFNIVKALGTRKVDLILSNAAFEHFENIQETIRMASQVATPGARFIGLVDLQTHSRWIRQKDPNNIYRYPKWLYRILSFRSTPNRVRPHQYRQALEEFGWTDIQVKPHLQLEEDRLASVKSHLHKQFVGEKNQMEYLSAWIYATKE